MQERRQGPVQLGLFLDINRGKGRRLLSGIHTALNEWPEAQPIPIATDSGRIASDDLDRFDAVLGEFDSYAMAKPFWELSIPMINLSNGIPTKRFPKSIMDEAAIGRLAADHLLNKGYQHFLCVTSFNPEHEHPAATGRAYAFRDRLAEQGHPCGFIQQPYNKTSEELLTGVFHLVKPRTGIFCWFDTAAYRTMKMALSMGLQVPDELGIIGANNDDLIVDICPIPLSSINLPWETTAVSAVRMVRQWLDGEKPDNQICRGIEIVERASTQRSTMTDPILSKCLAMIERNLNGDLSLTVLAQHAGASERLLYNRFHAHLKTTPARYILERRLKRAKRLLQETDLPVYEIAEACGFEDPNYFAAAFKRETGLTPSTMRKQG